MTSEPFDLPDHPLLTVRDIMTFLRVSKPALRSWVDAGQFPAPLVLGGRTHRWRRSDVVAWLEGRVAVA
jgi:excisionase family DNA binding protein